VGIYAMPDGFDPHVSIDKIATLRDLVIGCRRFTPTILEQAEAMLSIPVDNPLLPPGDRMKLWEILLNRAHGKPKQSVEVTIDGGSIEDKRVRVFMPDNGRAALSSPPTIEGVAK